MLNCRLALLGLLISSLGVAQPLPTANVHDLGFSAERLDKVRDYLQGEVDAKHFGGISVAVARHGRLVMHDTFGFQDIEAQKPMRTDTIFYIHSMTKIVTGTAAMMLFEEGKFLLNDPVSKYIPNFADVKVLASEDADQADVVAAVRPVTIAHLLTHTSGLVNRRGYRDAGIFLGRGTLKEQIDKLATVPLAHQPGEAWRYGDGLDVVARLVEIWSGKPYDVFLQQRIFDPLKMKDTTFNLVPGQHDRVSKIYVLNQDTDQVEERPEQRDHNQTNTYFPGGSGLYSTADDYIRLGQMLLNKGELEGARLLGSKTVEFMMQNHVPLDVIPPEGPNSRTGFGYGLGAAVLVNPAKWQLTSYAGEFQWGGAAGAHWWIDPETDLVCIWMVQRPPWGPNPTKLFRNQLYAAIVD
jgi:CubicO group peptidase (beta-lactamase class C family)